jgi:hypothetical protein
VIQNQATNLAMSQKCQFQTLLGLCPMTFVGGQEQRGALAVWRGLLFVVLGLSLLFLLEPLRQPQPHLRHVG